MVQLEGVAVLDLVVLLPLVGSPVTAGLEEAVEDGEEDGPLDVELEAARPQELLDNPPAAGLLPEQLEAEGRADAAVVDDRASALGMSGEDEDRPGESRPRSEQGIELAGLLELVEPAQGGDDALPGASALPAVLDDLEIGACPGGLGAEEHGDLPKGPP